MCDIWDALSALGTLAAVLVSLGLARRDRKRVRKMAIYQQFIQYFDKGIIKLVITLENIGNTPIIINEYGTIWNKNILNNDINKYLVNSYEPILINSNESKIVEYQYCFGYSFKEGEPKVENSEEFKLFSTANFIAKDTHGNQYPRKKLMGKLHILHS